MRLDRDIYKNDVNYFFSLHGPRFEFMNSAMAQSLSKRYGKVFKPIRILNAWPAKKYDQPNYIVLNKRGYELSRELKRPAVFLPDYEDVNAEFAESKEIIKIARKLHRKQRYVFVFPFTTSFLSLPEKLLTVLGPNAMLAQSLDSKINQAKLFDKLNVPRNKSRIFDDTQALIANAGKVLPAFISAAYTSGGSENGLIYSSDMLKEFLSSLRPINKHGPFVVSPIFEDIVLAPNVNAIVSGDGNVHTLVISDQILHGNRYLGNTFPSKATKTQIGKINSIIKTIGEYLASQGYRGLFGCDFLINSKGDLVVIDLNPRHQGGYACNGLVLQYKNISLTDLELAVFNDEPINITQTILEEPLGFLWAHSKLLPAEKGQQIIQEYSDGNIEEVFSSAGSSFVSEFYRKGSVFIDGYIGYQVHSAKDEITLQQSILETRQQFDAKVLGI